MERWLAIADFPGYEVSDGGNVRGFWKRERTQRGSIRVKTVDPVTVEQHVNPRGYLYIRIRGEDGVSRNLQVHRLVLAAFVGACPVGHEGCHRDGSRTDNRLANLYWGTRARNCLDTSAHGRNRNSKLSPEQVAEMIELRKQGMKQVDLAARFGVRQCSISNLLVKRGYRTHARH